jgi:tripartite-type tricarboxylate transporter receptor subunit TctC
MVARSTPDGYTVLISGAVTSAQALYTKLPYDTLTDLVPVISLGAQPLVVVSAPSRPYKTLADLIAAAKAKPGALNYSSAGTGSASHFAAERLRASAGFEAVHIPFKGGAEAVTDVIAGRSDFTVQLTATTVPQIRQGSLVALAVSAHQRIALLPDVPTTIEAGLPADSVYPFYTGVYLPAKTPRAIVEKLHREIAKALTAPAVLARFAALGVEPMPQSQTQFEAFVRDDLAANIALVKTAKIPTQ